MSLPDNINEMKLFSFEFFRKNKKPPPETAASNEEEFFPDPVEIEITDIFDLHSIPPKQVNAVIKEYLYQAHNKGFRYVRIIHGKGIGVQREATRKILSQTDFVESFSDAPPEAGGWGATIVEMKEKSAEC